MNKKAVYRAIDANLNRLREGLRVCEDTARFIFNNKPLSARIKRLRHGIKNIISQSTDDFKDIIKFRDSEGDFGRFPQRLEKERKDAADIFTANLQRAKESARALEEFTKLINVKISDRFKKIRFKIYSLEKEIFEEL